jgi:hypothetical protein
MLAMKSPTKRIAVLAGSFLLVGWLLLWSAGAAVAQVSVDPSVTATENKGDWTWGMAILISAIGGLSVLGILAMYMRFAPRFSTDEEAMRVVRADRVLPGKEPPRRAVDLSQAVPVVVAPPAIPVAAAAASTQAAAPAAPTSAAVAPAAAPAPATPAPAAAAAAAPEPGAGAAPAPAGGAAPEPAAGAAPAPETSAPAAAPAAPATAEHAEVTMDQEVFEQTLKELLDQGTDRRIAEGRARRAGMLAARKKASGEG